MRSRTNQKKGDMMKSLLAIISVTLLLMTPAHSDEVTDVVAEAMDAYADGDVKGAKSDLEFAVQLLSQMAAAGLEQYLPEPQDGWTMELDRAVGQGMALFGGGGTFAKGLYSNEDGRQFELQIMAGGQMVASMGILFGSSAALASKGKLVRIQRQKFALGDGEVTGMVGDNVLIQGQAFDKAEDAMLSHLKEMDMKALADF